jgi:hypothetical protein
MKNKDIDYTSLDYTQFKKQFSSLNELESAAGSADELKAADLITQKAKLDQQIAGLQKKKAELQKQIDAIEKK